MLNKLKEGMHIRTKDGLIDKVIIDYKGCCNSPNCNCKHVSCEHNYYDEENIIKASYNLIDLIEEGDYVNECLVIEKPYCYHDVYFVSINSRESWGWGIGEMPITEIKSIVTKEQFNSVKYEVE